MSEEHDAVEKAKSLIAQGDELEVVTLSTGYRARIVPVGATLIDDIVATIKEPSVPKFFNKEKDREEENPMDPDYLAAVTAATDKRNRFALDAMIMFGMELVDGLPKDDNWIKKLKYLEKKGALNLSEFDFDDPFEREYLFKRFIAAGTVDIIRIGQKAGLSAAAVEEAARSFKSNP